MNPTGHNSKLTLDDVLQEIALKSGPMDPATLSRWKTEYPQFAAEIEDFVTHWLDDPVLEDDPLTDELLEAIVTRARLHVAQVLNEYEAPLSTPQRRPSDRRLLGATAVALAVAAAGVFYLPIAFRGPVSNGPSQWTTYETAYGEHRTVTLRDGSTIELNTHSTVKVLLDQSTRRVSLSRGEAIFQIAHDPHRPFVVEAGRISIADVGTQFDVYRKEESPDEHTTRVAVFEGAVQILTPGKNEVSVTAGQQIDVADNNPEVSRPRGMSARDRESMTAWRQGKLALDGRLQDVLVELERYDPICFKTTDPKILDLPLGAELQTPDVNSFLQMLTLMGIHSTSEYNESGERTVILGREAANERGKCL
jgi:transmembrane sensor